MLPRQLAEAKNTLEHNMAAQERAHDNHPVRLRNM